MVGVDIFTDNSAGIYGVFIEREVSIANLQAVKSPRSLVEEIRNKLNEWFSWCINKELDYSFLTREGISPAVVSELQAHGFQGGELDWIISRQRLSGRTKRHELLTRDESAKAIRVARLVALAETVFADPEKAHRWLSQPKKQLNGLTPKDALQDEFGAVLVSRLLIKIDNGFF